MRVNDEPGPKDVGTAISPHSDWHWLTAHYIGRRARNRLGVDIGTYSRRFPCICRGRVRQGHIGAGAVLYHHQLPVCDASIRAHIHRRRDSGSRHPCRCIVARSTSSVGTGSVVDTRAAHPRTTRGGLARRRGVWITPWPATAASHIMTCGNILAECIR